MRRGGGAEMKENEGKSSGRESVAWGGMRDGEGEEERLTFMEQAEHRRRNRGMTEAECSPLPPILL